MEFRALPDLERPRLPVPADRPALRELRDEPGLWVEGDQCLVEREEARVVPARVDRIHAREVEVVALTQRSPDTRRRGDRSDSPTTRRGKTTRGENPRDRRQREPEGSRPHHELPA